MLILSRRALNFFAASYGANTALPPRVIRLNAELAVVATSDGLFDASP